MGVSISSVCELRRFTTPRTIDIPRSPRKGGVTLRSIIKLTISGDVFLFEDNGFTQEQKNNLQKMADIVSQKKIQQKFSTEKELCLWFINEAKANLGINLEQLEISFVVRINYNLSN